MVYTFLMSSSHVIIYSLQCILTLLDSQLNKSGHLKVYVRTSKHVLIEFNSKIRLPRTFKRFSGLIGLLPQNFLNKILLLLFDFNILLSFC